RLRSSGLDKGRMPQHVGPVCDRESGDPNVRFGSKAEKLRMSKCCPLYPRKRTSSDTTGMSALCQKRTHALQQKQHLYSITSSARCWSSASTSLANHVNRHPARSYAWSINRTARAQSCTLIGGAAPRRQWSSASRSVVKTGAVTLAPGRVSSPSTVASFMIPSFIVRIASRPAIFHSPSVPSRGEAIADLDGTENAARRAEDYRSVVLNRVLMRAPAQLGASHLRLLAGQVEEHVQPVRAQVPEAAAAGLGGIEHPGAIPRWVARWPRPVDPDVDVRQRAKAPRGEQLAGPRGEGRVALRQRDGDERIKPCR